jgi:hypothetical protein
MRVAPSEDEIIPSPLGVSRLDFQREFLRRARQHGQRELLSPVIEAVERSVRHFDA